MFNTPTSRRDFMKLSSMIAVTPLTLCSQFCSASPDLLVPKVKARAKQLPHAKSSKLPRWRGFNLLEKFNGMNKPFREDDFQNISDLGFNFVRLPMDYRCWIVDGDKRKFNEQVLSEIDQAVEFGEKYGIHIHMNFHRAPGYTVAYPPESPLVWKDEETLDVCKLHWQTFAKRYRNVSSDQLSFNLFNEPSGCTEEEYYKVVKVLVEAIRQENPDRIISCDGIDYGVNPCYSFKDLKVAQSTRGYSPMEISHYGASWVNSQDFPTPQWPNVSYNALLPVPSKQGMPKEALSPLTIAGPFPENSTLRFRLGVVSNHSEIVVKMDNAEVYNKAFTPKSGQGEWKEVKFEEKYGIYQNLYDLDIELPIPNGTKSISIANQEGDWATITELEITSSTKKAYAIGVSDWQGKTSKKLHYDESDGTPIIAGGTVRGRQWLWDNHVKPWKEAERQGIGVMVGEFGSHNVTPHPVVLRWMEDMLINWKQADWGWALWNFRGSFGIADSERQDVDYEDWRGLKLDRKMLELLQKY